MSGNGIQEVDSSPEKKLEKRARFRVSMKERIVEVRHRRNGSTKKITYHVFSCNSQCLTWKVCEQRGVGKRFSGRIRL